MTVVVDRRSDLTLENFRRVSRGGEGVRLGEGARAAMVAARGAFVELIESDRAAFVYGVTVRPGAEVGRSLAAAEQRAWASEGHRDLSPAFDGGGFLPERVVRGIVFARLTADAEAPSRQAPVRPVVAEDRRVSTGTPRLRSLVVGRSTRHTAARRSSPGTEARRWRSRTARRVRRRSPPPPALVARERLATAVRVLALSIEAYRAPLAYDEALGALWEDDGEVAALAALHEQLAGAEAADRLAHQAPVSYPIIPRVLGHAYRAVAALAHAARVSLRSASANPIFLPPDSPGTPGRVFSTGGYHNGLVYPALSAVSAAWADVLFVIERHVTALHFGGSSRHLPPMLERPGGRGGRTNLLGWVAGSFLEDARHAASATLLPAGLADMQNDVAAPTFAAYHKHTAATRALDAGLALLAASASQALWATDRQPAPALQPLLDVVRSVVAPVDDAHGRSIGDDLAQLAQQLAH